MKTRIFTIITLILFLLGSTPSFADYGVQTKTSHCIASVLPDPACSPGAVLTTDIKTICKVGYTATVRNVSTATKKKVFQEYDISYSQHSNYEVDHIISLELGGSNEISNLYPESYLIKNGARVKDTFENYLHKQVCAGKLSITDAQYQISTDWLSYNTARLNPTKTPVVKTNPSTPAVTIPTPVKAITPTTSVQSTVSIPQVPSTSTSEPAVKKSSSGLCHAIGTTYYTRTTKYTAYASIADCLASGGKLPAR
jgi:hypothetical protein